VPRITVVNDNPEFLDMIRDVLEDERYEIITLDVDTPDTLARIRASHPDLLLIDLLLGNAGDEGWRLAQQIRSVPGFERLPVIVCSGDLPALLEIQTAIDDTARAETLAKPFAIDQLTEAVDRLLGETIGG
jgi:CheY-like chemotaxis protein